MALLAPLFHHYSPRFSLLCSSSPHCSSSIRPRFNSDFIAISEMNDMWKKLVLRAFAVSTTQGDVASSSGTTDVEDEPEHLLVLVHGIMGSPNDWTYVQTELKRQLGRSFLVHASSCNAYTKTFTGIDGAGKRLAEEIMVVVKERKSLKKISFLAHSLGGLIARYAVAALYTPTSSSDSSTENRKPMCSSNKGLIAELEPINFITLATPHLGVRGNKQLPFLFGVSILEKLAAPMAPIFAGQTGSQLFLTDEEPEKPPLLLRMASDCEDGKFISALGAFRCRIIYANMCYDHMVGWRTSSIRRKTELIERTPTGSLDGYKHVVDVKHCPAVSSEGPQFPPIATKVKEAAQNDPTTQNTLEYHEILEEEMIRGLQQLEWKKVDVSFESALLPFFAHNNINVKIEWLHNAGAGVVAHVVDNIKQQEFDQFYAANLQ